MAITFKIKRTGDGGFTDYTDYVYARRGLPTARKVHVLNSPPMLQIALREATGFLTPERGNEVQLDGTLYSPSGELFTGFIVNEPRKVQAGTDGSGSPIYNWHLDCTSEEIVCDFAAAQYIPTMPPYMNKTVGEIIKDLLALLYPGRFDVTEVDDGPDIPYFRVGEGDNFTRIVQRLCDRSSLKFWTRRGKAFLKALNDDTLGIDANELDTDYDPASLDVRPLPAPVFNDVTGIGDIEPQDYVREYFIGDGVSMRFPLVKNVFGASLNKLLQDDFNDSSIDTNIWTETDPGGDITEGASLALNGGNGINLTKLVAKNPIEIGGTVLLQHGALRVNTVSAGASGIIGGLHSDSTNHTVANCVWGFNVEKDGTQLKFSPLVNGVVPSGAVPLTTQSGKDYLMMTALHTVQRVRKLHSIWALFNPTAYGGSVVESFTWASFLVFELDQNDPSATPNRYELYGGEALSTEGFLSYAIINGDTLDIALNYCQVSRPLDALLLTRNPTGGDFSTLLMGHDREFNKDATIVTEEAHELGFFGEIAPAVGTRIETRYRAAGSAIARVKKASSITDEANRAGDAGVRAGLLPPLEYPPRNARELEDAIKAFIDDHTSPIYEGTFAMSTLKRTPPREPIPGRFLTVAATSMYSSFSAFVNQVITDIIVETPAGSEIMKHSIHFGIISRFAEVKKDLLGVDEKAEGDRDVEPTTAIEFDDVATAYVQDTDNAKYTYTRTSNTFQIDTGFAPSAGYRFEIRTSDADWGESGTPNLITIEASAQTFTLTRSSRRQSYYMKYVEIATKKASRYPALIQINFPLVPGLPASADVDVSDRLLPKVTLILPVDSRDVYGIEIRDDDDSTVLYKVPDLDTTSDLPLPVIPGMPELAFEWKNNRDTHWHDHFDYDSTAAYTQTNCSLAVPSGSVVRFTASASDPYFYLPSASFPNFSGAAYQYVAMRYRYISGGLLAGQIFYETSGHGFEESYKKIIQLDNDGQWHTDFFNMFVLTSGGTDWTDSEITNVRFDPTGSSDAVLDIDFVCVVASADRPLLARDKTLYAYTWNALSEYSPSSLQIDVDMPVPVVSGAEVNERSQALEWVQNDDAQYFAVEISPSGDFSIISASGDIDGNSFSLSILDLVNPRYWRVRAEDGLGPGAWVSGYHVYDTDEVVSWSNAENIITVDFPPSPGTDPAYPSGWAEFMEELINQGWLQKIREEDR